MGRVVVRRVVVVQVMHHMMMRRTAMMVAHMMVMVVRMARVMPGRGKSGRSEQRRCHGDNGQGCKKATHWRLRDECFSAITYHS